MNWGQSTCADLVRGDKIDLYSLYSSITASVCIVALSSFPISEAAFRSLGLSASGFAFWSCTYLITVFIHLASPTFTAFWIVPFVISGILLIEREFVHRAPRSLCIGILLMFAEVRFTSWYPFMTWHKLPVELIWGILWFVAAELLAGEPRDRAAVIAGAFTTSLGSCVFGQIHAEWTSQWSAGQSCFVSLCNHFWVALVGVSTVEVWYLVRRRLRSSASRHFI